MIGFNFYVKMLLFRTFYNSLFRQGSYSVSYLESITKLFKFSLIIKSKSIMFNYQDGIFIPIINFNRRIKTFQYFCNCTQKIVFSFCHSKQTPRATFPSPYYCKDGKPLTRNSSQQPRNSLLYCFRFKQVQVAVRVVVVLRSPIHANEPSEYNGMLYRSSNRVLNNGIKVIILICMDGTSQYHHYRSQSVNGNLANGVQGVRHRAFIENQKTREEDRARTLRSLETHSEANHTVTVVFVYATEERSYPATKRRPIFRC